MTFMFCASLVSQIVENFSKRKKKLIVYSFARFFLSLVVLFIEMKTNFLFEIFQVFFKYSTYSRSRKAWIPPSDLIFTLK